MYKKICSVLLASIVFISCNDEQNPSAGKPIILGDSSTIVTETEAKYLEDFVADIKPLTPREEAPADTATSTPRADTTTNAAPAAAPEAEVITGKGLTVAFKEVTVFIPGIETRTYQNINLEKAHGASYELTDGKLQGNQLKIAKGTVTRVSQRHQTIIVAKTELGTLVLESLNTLSEWEPIDGKGNTYTIANLDKRHLDHAKPSAAGIRNAVSRAVKNARMSRTNQNKWVKELRNVKSVNQKPMTVVLRSVMWKIDGKDENGRPFQKQVRIDIPY